MNSQSINKMSMPSKCNRHKGSKNENEIEFVFCESEERNTEIRKDEILRQKVQSFKKLLRSLLGFAREVSEK